MSTYRYLLRAKEKVHEKVDKGYTFYVQSCIGNGPNINDIRQALKELEGEKASIAARSTSQFDIVKSERVN